MADSCAQYVSADDLKAAKESILHIEHVATSKDANGNPALVVTDPIRGVGYTNATLDGLFSDIGFKPVNGSFEDGGTLVNRWDVLLYETNGAFYQWVGAIPVGGLVVPAGSSPFDSSNNLLPGWVDRSDLTLRSDLADPDKGPNLVAYSPSTTYNPGTVGEALGPYAATGATNKFSKEDRANRQIYSDDFGVPGTDSGNSINLAFDYMKTVGDAFAHGGKVNIPRGFRIVDTAINLNRYTGSDVTDNLTLCGEGAGTSELRAGTALTTANDPVVRVGSPGGLAIQQYHLDSFSTRGGYNGVRVETASRGNITRVKIENPTNDGIYIGNSWVNVFSGILVNNAGSNGVNFDPGSATQKTSTLVNSGYVNGAAGACWVWGHMNYSAATAVAADNAGSYGHHIKNSEGFTMTSCGNESAQRSGIFAEASSAIGANRSVLIQGHFSHNSNLSNGGWANLLHARSLNGVDNRITIKDSTSHAPNFSTPDIIADGVGTVVVNDNNVTPNGVRTYNGGYIDHVHHPLLINSLSIPAATATAVCNLGSTQGHTTNVSAETSAFAGKVTILASTSNPSVADRRIAIYELFVCVSVDLGKQVTQISALGFVSGSVASAPSFTWTINSANRLVATPIGSAAGTFWFEVTTNSQVKATKL